MNLRFAFQLALLGFILHPNLRKLTATGKEEADLVTDNSTKEGRAQNRRVEAKLKTLVKKLE